MRGSDKRIAVTAAVAICSFVTTVVSVPTPVMATFAFALLASLGYVWIEVILRGRAPTLELVSVAVGLVLAVPVIGGVLLQAAGIPLHRLAWSVLFAGLTLAGDVILTFRHRSQPREEKFDYEYPLRIQRQDQLPGTPPAQRPPWELVQDSVVPQSVPDTSTQPGEVKSRRHISPWQAGACGLALLITGGAIWLAQAGAASQQYPGFTELWLTAHSFSTSTDNLGISNQEGRTENYRLSLQEGRVSTKWDITLTPGQTWQRAVRVTAEARADLYLLPNLTKPYRYVDTEP